jgi:dipeptidyl aminopeptidase/acylaminoacyl peptidase
MVIRQGLLIFCGPFAQRAVQGVIEKLRAEGYAGPNKILIEGISRGGLVAGLIAARNPSIAGVVLRSGLYNLPKFLAEANSDEAKKVADSIREETAGGESALAERSVLRFVKNMKADALIMNGAKDDRTDPSQAEPLAAEIIANGGNGPMGICVTTRRRHLPST